MIRLGLQEPTEEQLLIGLKEALISRRLLENEDFGWWMKKLEEGGERYKDKLVKATEPAEFYQYQGSIRAIRMSLNELRLRAAEVESIEERLREHDRRKQPVARGA